jgi:hypothetical protein
MDFYGGYKKEVAEGLTQMVVYSNITIQLATSQVQLLTQTQQSYIAGTYSFATLKVSYFLTDLFGFTGSKGSRSCRFNNERRNWH